MGWKNNRKNKKKDLFESENLELKAEYNKDTKDKILKTIYGFSNTSGGYLIIGIKDNKEICGITNIQLENINRDLSNIISRSMINLSFTEKFIDEKTIFIINVEEGNDKPYFYNDDVYRRVLSTTRKAGPDDIKILYRELHTIKERIISIFKKYTYNLGFLEWVLIEKKYNSQTLNKLKRIDYLFIEWKKIKKDFSFNDNGVYFYFCLKDIVFEEDYFYVKLDILKTYFFLLNNINNFIKIDNIEEHIDDIIFDSSLLIKFDYDFEFKDFITNFNFSDMNKNSNTINILQKKNEQKQWKCDS